MKIQKEIEYNAKKYSFLSDDSRDVLLGGTSDGIDGERDRALFVQTRQNELFARQVIEARLDILQARDLPKFFSLTPKIIGITGTNGKTTTAAIIYSILLDLGYSCALLGTRGFFANDEELKPKGLTTPSILELYANIDQAESLGCEYFVMEVSSHSIVQNRIEGLEFCAKVLTNITSDHLDYHHTLQEYIRVKNSFFSGEDLKIINRDEGKVIFNPENAYGYAIEAKSNLSVNAYSHTQGINAHISWKRDLHIKRDLKQEVEQAFVDSPLYGLHNLYNILAAVTCVKCLTNKSLETIAATLGNFAGVSGRMEVVSSKPLVIVDFAHTYDGMKQIFESFKSRKISVVFGAGGDRDRSKRPKMGECAYTYAYKIYITSDNPRTEDPNDIIKDIFEGIPLNPTKPVIALANRKKTIQKALDELALDEVLLVLGKGDETYQIIGNKKHHFDDREVIREYLKISQLG